MTEAYYMPTPVPTNGIASANLDSGSVYVNKQEYRVIKYYPIDTNELEMSFIDVLTLRMGKKKA